MNEDQFVEFVRGLRPVHGGMPAAYLPAIDRASESDKLYFEQHPDREVRLRRPLPGEFGPYADESLIAFVRVDKVRDGTRLRTTIFWVGRLP